VYIRSSIDKKSHILFFLEYLVLDLHHILKHRKPMPIVRLAQIFQIFVTVDEIEIFLKRKNITLLQSFKFMSINPVLFF